jgi:hypothetical protein
VVFLALPSGPAQAAAPPNDNIGASENVPIPASYALNNEEATTEVGEILNCGGTTMVGTVWYSFWAAYDRTVVVDTFNSLSDTVVAVYTEDGQTQLGCNDDFGGQQSRLEIFLTAGSFYKIQVGSVALGDYLEVHVNYEPAPPNDDIANAEEVLSLSLPVIFDVNNESATSEFGEPICASLIPRHTLWYVVQAQYSTNLVVDTLESDHDTVLAAYLLGTQMACNDNFGGSAQSWLTVPVDANDLLFVQAGSTDFDEFGNLLTRMILDKDLDGVSDDVDNCFETDNGPAEEFILGVGNQLDFDGDGGTLAEPLPGSTWGGDACDADDDNDGKPDVLDGCRTDAEDYDQFEDGDGCKDADNDGDGICDNGLFSVSCTGSDVGSTAFYPPGHDHAAPVIDCRNIDEDYDSFKDGDGCPEPDNDNDNFPDFADDCPGVDFVAGPDGALGVGADFNHNGREDGGEVWAQAGTPGNDDTVIVFEDFDTIIDNDGCHDSPGDDYDHDGFTDEAEVLFIGTDPVASCPAIAGSHDAWPVDINMDRTVTLFDLLPGFKLGFNSVDPDPRYSPRYDLNTDGAITLFDLLPQFKTAFNTSCTS